jgi:hypothetical protein
MQEAGQQKGAGTRRSGTKWGLATAVGPVVNYCLFRRGTGLRSGVQIKHRSKHVCRKMNGVRYLDRAAAIWTGDGRSGGGSPITEI